MEKQRKFGFIGIFLGAVALIVALVHFWAGPFAVQKPLEVSVADKILAVKEATVAKLKGEEYVAKSQYTTSKRDLDDWLDIGIVVLAALAIILGVVGFATKEEVRPAIGAAALGGAAIGFQLATFVIFALLFVLLVWVVLSSLGIDLS